MKLPTQLSVIAVSLMFPMAHAQSPFGPPDRSAAAAGASVTQARAALAPEAARKTSAAHMDTLLEKESNEFIVMFKDEAPARLAAVGTEAQQLAVDKSAFKATRQGVRAAFANGDLEFVREYGNLPMALVRTRSRAALVKLLNHPKVRGVMENVAVPPAMGNSLPAIGHPGAMETGVRGLGTTVVVLDQSPDYRAPELGSCTSPYYPEGSCRVVDAFSLTGEPMKMDPRGHGTRVAAIVAAVAPGAKLVLVDIHKDNDEGTTARMIQGIDWSIDNRDRLNIVAINLSYGKPDVGCAADAGGVMSGAFTRALDKRIISVVAAGNQGNPTYVNFPACAAKKAKALVVGATFSADGPRTMVQQTYGPCLSNGSRDMVATCLSNAGNDVSIYAPGTLIAVGGMPQDSGTSFAAPHVSGAIAVLRGVNAAPWDEPQTTIGRLLNTGLTAYHYRNKTYTPRLNLYRSLLDVSWNLPGALMEGAPAPLATGK